MKFHYLTFDIEDFFDADELSDTRDWDRYAPQVVENTERILSMLRKHRVRATFFVVGKVAARHPDIVKRIVGEGHSLGSHGYAHKPFAELGETGFIEDLALSKRLLEEISGISVSHHRAMGFSIRDSIPRHLAEIGAVGYRTDSSVLETRLGSMPVQPSGAATEIPVSSTRFMGRHIPLGGGLFFRLAPLVVLRRLLRHYETKGRPFVLYLHSWEFNRDQPRRRVPFGQRFAQAPVTFTSPAKLQQLLCEFTFVPIQ